MPLIIIFKGDQDLNLLCNEEIMGENIDSPKDSQHYLTSNNKPAAAFKYQSKFTMNTKVSMTSFDHANK